ncbi:putative S-adenosyl-L-methionine-dependent methyltransferase [Mycobacterium tuberculosis]|nr:putative S-adenosyl-L-methionine-dependent methyltransferase [Mycobacterium tuberculosis]
MRTEGDSWDITTSVGSTALFVATARALEAQKSDPLVVDPYAEAFCRAVGGRGPMCSTASFPTTS